PYAHPERMGTIYTRIAGSSEASDKRHNVNGEQWELLRDNVPALISAVSGGGTSGVNLKAGSHVEYVHAGRVSAHYFDVLALEPGRESEGSGTNFSCIIRLRDGATWREADAQVNRTWSSRVGRYELADNPGAKVSYHAVPLQKAEAASLRPQVLALMVAAGFILVIACANLAGLTLVRMMRRTPEVATRLALGASGWQIQRQFWIENLLLALVGG